MLNADPFLEKGPMFPRNLSIFMVDSQHGQQAYRRMAHLRSSSPKLKFAQQLLSGYLAASYLAVHFFAYSGLLMFVYSSP